MEVGIPSGVDNKFEGKVRCWAELYSGRAVFKFHNFGPCRSLDGSVCKPKSISRGTFFPESIVICKLVKR